MNASDVQMFVCPRCRASLELSDAKTDSNVEQALEIKEGLLVCKSCGGHYPVVKGIARFVQSDNYARNFGLQWRRFARTQMEGEQMRYSRERFDATTRWPRKLKGQLILEAGCGAGRFSRIALETGAEVYSFDLSEAVEACLENNEDTEYKKRHHAFQASLYEIPLPQRMFDKIFCLGVLQHCPDVKKAYMGLIPFLKPGGELVVDCYLSEPRKHAFHLKYLLRPFVKWWPPRLLYLFCSAAISITYDVKRFLARIPCVGAPLTRLIPIGRLNYEPEQHLTIPEIKEMKTLSVFDMLGPKYDYCQTIESFRTWMREGRLEVLDLTLGYNGINARGRKPPE